MRRAASDLVERRSEALRLSSEICAGSKAYLHLPPKVIDASALAPEKATELARLVAMPVREDKREHGVDLMSYTITVEENGQPTLLRQSQTNMTPAFKALHDWLEEHPK